MNHFRKVKKQIIARNKEANLGRPQHEKLKTSSKKISKALRRQGESQSRVQQMP